MPKYGRNKSSAKGVSPKRVKSRRRRKRRKGIKKKKKVGENNGQLRFVRGWRTQAAQTNLQHFQIEYLIHPFSN